MREVNLIPATYQHARKAMRLVHYTGWTLLAMAILGALTWGALQKRLSADKPTLLQRRSEAIQIATVRKNIDSLQQRKASLARQAAALATLRGTGEVQRMVAALDAAINDGTWLTSLRFTRAEQEINPAAAKAVQTGYFIVVPANANDGSAAEKTWTFTKKIAVHGQALDHTQLAEFMQRLTAQPGIADVRLVSSRLHSQSNGQVIDFEAAAAIAPTLGKLP